MARGFKMGPAVPLGGDALPADILLSKTAYVDGEEIVGTMPNIGAISELISAVAQEIALPEGYHDGTGTVEIDPTEVAKIIAENIKSGVTILGQAGSLQPGVDTSDADAVAGNILNGKIGYVKGAKVTGSIPIQAAKTVTPATSAQTAVSSGTYCSGAITVAAIPSQTTGGAKYATTSAQTAVAASKYVTSNVTLGALSQTNLAAANIVRGKTITIKSGSTNIWSVTGSNDALKYVSGSTTANNGSKAFRYTSDRSITYNYSQINPGITPLFAFGYTDGLIYWRNGSAAWNITDYPADTSAYSNGLNSGWTFASNSVQMPKRAGGNSLTYFIFGY